MTHSKIKKLGGLLLVISAGVVAYGIGLYQGHRYRAYREISSVPATSNENSFNGSPLPLNTRGSTEGPKLRSE